MRVLGGESSGISAMAGEGWEICATWEVDEGSGSSLSDHVTVRDVHCGGGSRVPENGCIRLVPGPEKQLCEVTVRFQQQQHAIHCIVALSTARTCEVYRQNEGDTDAEYVCTARGQVESVNDSLGLGQAVKSFHRAEMKLEDPEFCTSVTIRLLSLQDKSHVIIGHVLVLVSPGPYLAGCSDTAPAPAQAPGLGGASAKSLGALAPLMLQMAQGFSMPDLKNKMSYISNSGAEAGSSRQRGGAAHEELAMRAMAAQAGPSLSPAPHPSPAKPEASLLEDVCQRLERLESVCARIETSLSKTLESFDKRLRILESEANGVDSET